MQKVNRFEMTGLIIAKYKREDGSFNYTVVTKSGAEAYVNIISGSSEEFPLRKRVKVTGHIEGSTYKDNKDGKIKTSQFFIADTIVPAKTVLEEVFPDGGHGHFYGDSSFIYAIAGNIVRIREQNGFIHLSVETADADGKAVLVHISEKKYQGFPDLKVGDKIRSVCGIYTKNRGYRTLTINDIEAA